MQKSYSVAISLTRNDRLACDESLSTSRLIVTNWGAGTALFQHALSRNRLPHASRVRSVGTTEPTQRLAPIFSSCFLSPLLTRWVPHRAFFCERVGGRNLNFY